MAFEEIYKQLTNIDINEQKQIWDERGKGYYGEYLLFCELYKKIIGNCKILMNLNVPANDFSETEIDLLLIHETGMYVFEIKHYKGTIYGKDTDNTWTQYFRTTKNNNFKNPIKQNDYHIRVIQNMFPDIPIYSFIVFTSNNCDIRVENKCPSVEVCSLSNVDNKLANKFKISDVKLSIDKIDKIFNRLSIYSKMQEQVVINKKEASFGSWVQPIIFKLEENKAELEEEKKSFTLSIEELKRTKAKGIFINVMFIIICIIMFVFYANGLKKEYDLAIQKNNNELTSFKQNFLHIDEIDNKYIDELNSYVKVSNVSLNPLTDDCVSFTARINMTNDVYGIALTKDSKYIVMTNSGKVFEYNVFGPHLSYSRIANMIGNGIRAYGDLAKTQFYGISNVDAISYIKMTKVELFKLDINRTLIKEGLEIELYSI